MCGETEIPAHALMTTVNQLKEPAAADEERNMAQSWGEEDTPTGFQRQFKVSNSIYCSYYVSVLCPITCANVFQTFVIIKLLLQSHNYVSACSDFE